MSQPTTICYVLSYRDPNYIRTRTLLAAFDSLKGVRVVQARNTSRGLMRYVETLRELWRIRKEHDPQIYVLGFRGHEIFWPVRWITRGRSLVFDSFVSPSDALISEAKHGVAGKLLGRVAGWLEKRMLKASDYLLTDTRLHSEFFSERFDVSPDKLEHMYVGADPQTQPPAADSGEASSIDNGPLRVLFYGTFLPLHGVDTITEAAALLADLPVQFVLIGGKGRSLERFQASCSRLDLKNVEHHSWVAFDELRDRVIPEADVCLGGPFGGTPQARRVITGKTFQFLALGKPTVIGNIDEDPGFIHGVNCLLVEQDDARALADSLRWAVEHREALGAMGRRARELYEEAFDTPQVARKLNKVIGLLT